MFQSDLSLDRVAAMDVSRTYDADFFAMHTPWRAEYDAIADAIADRLTFTSALDLGCGTGFLIARLASRGLDVAGVDGSPEALNFVPADIRNKILTLDLTIPRDLGKYDLVICCEVAEHLPPQHADTLVDTICRCASEWIFFTAAVPGQGGYGHLNEQPHSYWIEKFAQRGFLLEAELTSVLRHSFSQSVRTIWWFARNALLFRRSGSGQPTGSTGAELG
jgi:SAM-dependent methyltransferase